MHKMQDFTNEVGGSFRWLGVCNEHTTFLAFQKYQKVQTESLNR